MLVIGVAAVENKPLIAGLPVLSTLSILSARGGEESSHPPHADGKQRKLPRQLKNALFQVNQEAHLLRPNLHPVRYL